MKVTGKCIKFRNIDKDGRFELTTLVPDRGQTDSHLLLIIPKKDLQVGDELRLEFKILEE